MAKADEKERPNGEKNAGKKEKHAVIEKNAVDAQNADDNNVFSINTFFHYILMNYDKTIHVFS